jgi:hypothetical protein
MPRYLHRALCGTNLLAKATTTERAPYESVSVGLALPRQNPNLVQRLLVGHRSFLSCAPCIEVRKKSRALSHALRILSCSAATRMA